MIIGICGLKGSGKSEVAKYLAETHGFKRVNFKDALVGEMKERLPDTLASLSAVYSLTVDELFQVKPAVMRALMQNYGTEVRRKDDADHWVKQWQATVKETSGNIVVDDVRFFNELSAIVEADGVLIRIVRPDIKSSDTHQSETEQQKFIEDFTIEAEYGNLLSVHKQIEQILATIKAD
jgi:hypothetical protein